MIGILEFCLSRGLDYPTMLAEHRLAECIAAYGWPHRFLGALRAHEGGKGIAVAAEIDIGLHILALTRVKTGVTAAMLVEIDPVGIAPAGPASTAIVAPDDLRDMADALGSHRAGALIRTLSLAIAGADDRPRAIELTGAIARLFESAGLPVDSDLPGKRKQPGLSTGLPHQFVSNDRG